MLQHHCVANGLDHSPIAGNRARLDKLLYPRAICQTLDFILADRTSISRDISEQNRGEFSAGRHVVSYGITYSTRMSAAWVQLSIYTSRHGSSRVDCITPS